MRQSVRFLQVGDVHVGTTFRGSGFSRQVSGIRSRELLMTFHKACEEAIQKKVDFLLITGDLFEGRFIGAGQIKEIQAMINDLAPLPVLITPGNHDPLTIDSPYRRSGWGTHVHIFGPQVERVNVLDGCGVWGYGYPSSVQRENPYHSLRLQTSDSIEIVAIHGSVDAPAGSPHLPLSRAEIQEMGADYTALAHYHAKQIVWEEAGKVRAAYAGSLEPLGFDETGEHGAFVAEVVKGGARLQWLPLAKRAYRIYHLDVSDCGSARDMSKKIHSIIPDDSWGQDLLRIHLTGTLDSEIDLEPMKQEWSENGFWIEVINQTQLDYDLQGYAPDSVHGRFVKLLQERMESETDPERKQIIRMALTAGLDALTQGRVIDR